MDIGKNLKKRAKELDITDAEVARRLGIDPNRYSHYVTGRRQPRLDMLQKICKVLDMSFDELLGEEKTEKKRK